MHKSVENFILLWDLMEFKPKKGKYTWTKNRTRETNIVARLDRFLVQSSVLKEKIIISFGTFPKLSSNHKPILLQIDDGEDLSPIPFHFSPLWIDR